MAILNKGQNFSDGGQVTSEKLNTAVDGATFASGAVDDVSTQLSGGAIIVKDGGVGTAKIADDAVTPAKLSAGAPTWDTTNLTKTSSGSTVLTVESTGANDSRVRIKSGSSNVSYVEFADPDDVDTGEIRYEHTSNNMQFRVNGNNEAMRINSEGTLMVGTTDENPYDNSGTNTGIALHGNGSTQAGMISAARYQSATATFNRLGNDGNVVGFYREGVYVGAVFVTATATAYNTSSDYRLKEDVIEMEGSLDRLKGLKPCNFRWKADGTRVDGFIAHEAQEVVPEAVTGIKDAVDDEGNPEYQGIDQSKLVPLLTKALQEAVAKIEALETRVTALES